MIELCTKLLDALQGYSLVTAESCTGGGIGAAITAVPGSSAVYKGSVICYANWVKERILGVNPELLKQYGPVSPQVAEEMVKAIQKLLQSDAAISVTGLVGPDGDAYGYPVGTVFIGAAFQRSVTVREYHFSGNRDEIRNQAGQMSVQQLLEMVL